MLRVVIPCFGRPTAFAEALPEIVARVGCEAQFIVSVDGDPAIPWHAVPENRQTSLRLGALTHVLNDHYGNGIAFTVGIAGLTGPLIKVDADVIPSPNYGAILLELAATAPPDVGCIVGLPRPEIPRHDAGLRRIPFGRPVPLRIALFTQAALAAIGDHATIQPLGEHDVLTATRLASAKLRTVYTHKVWVDKHIDTPDLEYDRWAKQYRDMRRGMMVTDAYRR